MAVLDSGWGTDSVTLNYTPPLPPGSKEDSNWGTASATLNDPTGIDPPDPTRSDSNWGTATMSLNDPLAGATPSGWGTASTTLKKPHTPIGIFNGVGYDYVAIQMWDGTKYV